MMARPPWDTGHAGRNQAAPSTGDSRFDPYVPPPARVYNAWLGGKDNYAADRHAANEVIRHSPQVIAGAFEHRSLLARVERLLAGGHGIRQFLDIGTGLPGADNTHEVAQQAAPECRIVYVDNDPLVLTHARALLTSTPEGTCDSIDADLPDTATILGQAARPLDFAQPDADDPASIVKALAAGLAPGSYIAISHLTADFAPGTVTAGVAAYNTLVPQSLTPRTRAQVIGLFAALPLLPPGVAPVPRWPPGTRAPPPPAHDLYAGVARTPGRH